MSLTPGSWTLGPWLRSRFLTGLFVAVPLLVSVSALVWIFGIIDGFTAPVSERILGRRIPGLGILIMVALVLGIGVFATNVIGRRVVARAESWLTMIPVFRTIYTPVRQLIAAFSPDNEYGFKQVVMVEDKRRGLVMGFLTKEFRVERAGGTETMMAVYVPTNHLYLGDIVMYPREEAYFPDLTVEEGIRIFLTGGMSLPSEIRETQQRHEPGASRADLT